MTEAPVTEIVYVVHAEPQDWDPPFDTVHFSLAPRLPGQVEKLWLKDLGDGLFQIVCIPFFCDGLARLDVLAIEPGVSTALHERSGHRVLRALWRPREAAELAAHIESLIAVAHFGDIPHEHHGEQFIAFDIAPGTDPADLVGSLEKLQATGHLVWEWGD